MTEQPVQRRSRGHEHNWVDPSKQGFHECIVWRSDGEQNAKVIRAKFTTSSRANLQGEIMNAIHTVKEALRPKFEDLLLHLNSTDQMAASGFFTKLFVDLNAVASEEQLLELFIELSTTAFLGISFDELALAQIDDILMTAEQVSHTFSVTGENPQ